MTPRTAFLSKLIGLYCLLFSLSMFAHKDAMLAAVTTLIQNPSMILILGAMTLVAGLALVLGHNVWSGGAATVIVTLVGWISLIKGLLFVFLTPGGDAAYFAALHYEQLFYLYGGIAFVIGAYLVYRGFTSREVSELT